MAVFITGQDFLGYDSELDLHRGFIDFLREARDIRTRLNERSNLLDEYLYTLLRAASALWYYQEAEQGYESGTQLNRICSDILRDTGGDAVHPFVAEAQAYIEANPVKPENHLVQRAMYHAMLTGRFTEAERKRRRTALFELLRRDYDGAQVRELCEKISAALGSPESMERLNKLFMRRFIFANASALYRQGASCSLLEALVGRDPQSGKLVIQLLIDGALPLE